MKQKVFNILILLAVCGLGTLQYLDHNCNKDNNPTDIEVIDIKSTFFTKSPEEGLIEALEYYEVQHPQIVYAQAVLETGNFKSNLCINSNNLFGLYNSRKNEYFTFNHWTESVEAYVNFIQYKYKPPNDYYKFLTDIGYAEDPEYINKLKRIVNRNDKRRSD